MAEPTAARSCPHCAEPAAESDRFCEACGGELRVTRASSASETEDGPEMLACTGCGRSSATAGQYCEECGLRLPETTDRVTLDLGAVAGVSDRGLVHHRNEDALALGWSVEGAVAAVVCDGVSSTVRPERAARAASDTALTVLLGSPDEVGPAPPAPAELMRTAVAAAAEAVHGDGPDQDGPSCTLVAAHVGAPETGPSVTIGWVGDSRAYWLDTSPPNGRQLTTDHSWAAEMVASGLLDERSAMADRQAHSITRWLGPGERPEPDLVTLRPTGPGMVLVCSDGLWNYLPEPDRLAEAAAAAGGPAAPLAVAEALTAFALEAGGRDNITVVVIPVTGTAITDTAITGTAQHDRKRGEDHQ